ncbi:MAG: hypothetical protein IH593_09400 [Bacteroidales bacterium]|nr:hypothetical protein [Bacteroidales bacterium]
MKKQTTLLVAILMGAIPSLIAQTNDFYDDAPTNPLKGTKTISINGEVGEEVIIDLNTLPLHSVIVKETTLNEGTVSFTGAYRYDGYSLYDILDSVSLKRRTKMNFLL